MGHSHTDKSSVLQAEFVKGLTPGRLLQILWMGAEEEEAEFNSRVKALFRETRMARGWTHKDMAAFLGIPEARYIAYETRVKSEVPPYLIPKFVILTGVDLHFAMGMTKPKALPLRPKEKRFKNEKNKRD